LFFQPVSSEATAVATLTAGPLYSYPVIQSYFCSMNSDTGKWIIIIGVFIVLAGIIIYFFHDKLHWIGRLPGDIRIEKGDFRFYFPLTSMIVFSVLVTLIVNIIKRFLH
jgi:hypothetical protein